MWRPYDRTGMRKIMKKATFLKICGNITLMPQNYGKKQRFTTALEAF